MKSKTIIGILVLVLVAGVLGALVLKNRDAGLSPDELSDTPERISQELADTDSDVIMADITEDFAALEEEYAFEDDFSAGAFDVPELDSELEAAF